jgi:hypothetical protein
MTMPDPRLLEIRLNFLETDVAKVKNVVDNAYKRAERIRKIADQLASHRPMLRAGHIVHRLQDILQNSPEICEEFQEHSREDPRVTLEELNSYIEEAKNLQKNAEIEIDEIASEALYLKDDQQRELATKIKHLCGKLHNEIDRQRNAMLSSPLDSKAYRRLWAEFDKMLAKDARPLFAEYVDFVGGLAVRDDALDDQVCAMTDRLLEELDLRHVLAVPARQAALGQIIQSVIMLGFPEWTIWGIPLVGHEVGLKYADGNNKDLQKLLNYRRRKDQKRWTSLFADIFAAYVLGPSYARAVIQLRFEPQHIAAQDDEDRSDVDRARLILKVLDRLYEQKLHDEHAYRDTVRQLQDFWQHEVDDLLPDSTGKEEELDKFLDKAWQILTQLPLPSFDRDRWIKASELQGYLLTGERPQYWPQVIDLLTAAWEIRTAAWEKDSEVWQARTKEPDLMDTVATRVKELGVRPPGSLHGVVPAGVPGYAGSLTDMKKDVSPWNR